MTERTHYKPLTYQKGMLQWPPESTNGKVRKYKSTELGWRKVLWGLHHLGGEVNNSSGLAMGEFAELIGMEHGQTRSRVQELTEMGAVVRDGAARKTYWIKLKLPVSKLPEPDPFSAPGRPSVAPGPAVEAPPMEPDSEVESPPPPPTAMTAEVVSDQQLFAQQLAVSLLERVTQILMNGAPAEAERGHLAGQVKKQAGQVQALEKELAIRDGRIKTLQSELAEVKDLLGRTERNLHAAVAAAKEFAEKAGVTVSQDTERFVANLMREKPGAVDRSRTWGS